MNRRIVKGVILMSLVLSCNIHAQEKIIYSPELDADILFAENKGVTRTMLLKDTNRLAANLHIRTASGSIRNFFVVLDYAYCSGKEAVLILGDDDAKKKYTIKVKKDAENKIYTHKLADGLCQDYIASTTAELRLEANFRGFKDELFYTDILSSREGPSHVDYSGSAEVVGADLIVKVTGTNVTRGGSSGGLFRIPKSVCQVGTGSIFHKDINWQEVLTLRNGKATRWYHSNNFYIGLADGICQKSAGLSLKNLDAAPALTNSSPSVASSVNIKNGKPLTMGELTQCTSAWVEAFNKARGGEGPIAFGQLDEWEQFCKEGKRP